MKKYILSIGLFLTIGFVAFSQAPPQGINYQAVALDADGREIVGVDAAGEVIAERAISVRFTIISGTATGINEYIEEHTTNTDQFGLFDLVIGEGNQTGGQVNDFSGIDWGSGAHFLKVEIDIEGGTNFKNMGVQQMMSVPYALYAASAGNASGGSGVNWLGTLSSDPASPNVNDAYYNDQDGASYIWDGADWNVIAQDGSDGQDGVDGQDGTNGTNGLDGIGITWLGTFATAPTSPNLNEAYYNSTDGISYIWDGSTWNIMAQDGSGGGGANTLGQAYNEGGPGTGRIINADNGAVQINGGNVTTTALEVNSTVNSSSSIRANNTATGVAIRAENSNASNTFATVQAITNSTDANNSAIIGNNDGAGFGVSGQIPVTATGTAAVYGSNLRTTGGSGVSGIGLNGVVGEATNTAGFGIYGLNSGTVPNSVGTYGQGWTSIYGELPTDPSGWAGYFNFDVNIQGGNLFVNGTNVTSDERLKSNVLPIENALEKIVLLDGKHYSKKINNASKRQLNQKAEDKAINERQKIEYGVIAQDLEKVFPDMVTKRAIFIASGDETEYKTVDYTQLIPVLIEAIKELNKKVERLEKQLEEEE